MKSLILKTAAEYLLPLLLLFSIFILLRGHYFPGGGFVGGLIASIAFVFYMFANGTKKARYILRIPPGYLMPIGLSLALLSGLAPIVLSDLPFLTGIRFDDPVPVLGIIGSALFFDTGVYLVVVGVTLTILFNISETI